MSEITKLNNLNEENNKKLKRSIYVINNIKKGEKISKRNIGIIRPNFGLSPKFFNKLLGRISKKNLLKGTPLKFEYLK